MASGLRSRVLYAKRVILRPWLYRYPPFDIRPEHLYLWTHALMRTRDVPGAVVEVGCSLGGTAAWCDRMLRQSGVNKRYVCVDTFGGFVEQQLETDFTFGTPMEVRHAFGANSLKLTRRIVDGLGSPNVELLQGDIVSLPAERLPSKIAACLIDVDLYEPIYSALMKIRPRLSPGGIVLVDECSANESHYKAARAAYSRFMADQGRPERYEFGMGVFVASDDEQPGSPE